MSDYRIFSDNQLHGKRAEDILKACFPGASDNERSPFSLWDIEARFDADDRLPTSIKTSINNSINFADARNIWSVNEKYRLLIWRYHQVNVTMIQYDVLDEYIVMRDEHRKLLGNITSQEVEDYHKSIQYDRFSKDETEECREFAQAYKIERNFENRSLITLCPKIQDTQRRVQGYIGGKVFGSVVKDYRPHHDFYKDIAVVRLAKRPPRKTRTSN